jgi:hypothetical protein
MTRPSQTDDAGARAEGPLTPSIAFNEPFGTLTVTVESLE